MNTQPQKNKPRVELPRLVNRAAQRIAHNWPWKLLALFLALCLWAGLITQDKTLTRERVFYDVPVTISGSDTLRRNNGLIVVSGLDDEALTVRMRVEVPQGEYNTVTASNYNPRVELSRIKEAGEQTLRIATSSTSTYGSVTSIWPDTVTVVVDEYVTNYRVPVVVNITGEYPDGYRGGTASADPSSVTISGPKSVVDQIVRVYVDYSLEWLPSRAGRVRTALPMRFTNADGETIESDLLEVTSAEVVLRSIIVDQTLYPTRTLSLSAGDLIQGQPADGYRVVSTGVSPSSILAAGEEDSLALLEELYLESPVDVSGATESFTATVKVRKPGDVNYLSAETVTVAVQIEPVEISRTFDSVKLFARGLTDGLKAGLSQKTLNVVLTGPQLALQSLRAANVTAWVDVSGLTAGEYVLPVQVRIENGTMDGVSYLCTPAEVTVVLSE